MQPSNYKLTRTNYLSYVTSLEFFAHTMLSQTFEEERKKEKKRGMKKVPA